MTDLFDTLPLAVAEYVPETEAEPGIERFRHVKCCARCGGTGADRAFDAATGTHWLIRMSLASLRAGHLCTRCFDAAHPAFDLPLKPR